MCLGTSIFISLSVASIGQNGDLTRVFGQVVTGIGFLGAGVIIAREGLVLGITSASVIWVLAGIPSLITLIILIVVGMIENRFPGLQRGFHIKGEDRFFRKE